MKVLIFINLFINKVPAVHKTWAKDCDKFFFVTKMLNVSSNISHEYSSPFPILHPAYHDNEAYNKLTIKVLRTFQDLYLRYNNYDWYLKADDDTFIFVDNLRSFLKTKNSSQPVTYGYDFGVTIDHGYHSGGAGYVLSNEAIKRLGAELVSNFSFCKNTQIEDIDVAGCLRIVKVYPEKSIDDDGAERFHPFHIKNHVLSHYPSGFLQYSANAIKLVR